MGNIDIALSNIAEENFQKSLGSKRIIKARKSYDGQELYTSDEKGNYKLLKEHEKYPVNFILGNGSSMNEFP